MYKYLPVLKSPAFGRYREKMKVALEGDECPTDYKLAGGLLTWVGPAVSDIGRKDGIDGAWYAYDEDGASDDGTGQGTEDERCHCFYIGGGSRYIQKSRRRDGGIPTASIEVGDHGR
jgi:hypothetical protein